MYRVSLYKNSHNLSNIIYRCLSTKNSRDHDIQLDDHVETAIKKVKVAQKEYSKFNQQQVDFIFEKAAMAACLNRIPLAKLSVAETKMGIVEDKVIKNHFASEYIYNHYKNEKTCGVIEVKPESGIKKIAEPMGVLAAVIPWYLIILISYIILKV
jgi:acyl-CoA reductase-like NAD-dependent aldehyde dehydrogenase